MNVHSKHGYYLDVRAMCHLSFVIFVSGGGIRWGTDEVFVFFVVHEWINKVCIQCNRVRYGMWEVLPSLVLPCRHVRSFHGKIFENIHVI